MIDTLYLFMVTIMGTLNIYAVILCVLLIIFIYAIWKSPLNWTDMITRDGNKISATKILQLVGGVVGTWIMIQATLGGTLTWDLFGIYLTYVASIDGFSKFMLAKYGAGPDMTTTTTISQQGTPIDSYNAANGQFNAQLNNVQYGGVEIKKEVSTTSTQGGAKTPDFD